MRAGRRKLSVVPVTGYTSNAITLMNLDLERGDSSHPPRTTTRQPFRHRLRRERSALPGLDPIGRTVYVHGYPLRVIGLQAKLGKVLGQNRDKVIFVPLSFLQKVMTANDGIAIMVRPRAGMEGSTTPKGKSGRSCVRFGGPRFATTIRSESSARRPSRRSGGPSRRGPSP